MMARLHASPVSTGLVDNRRPAPRDRGGRPPRILLLALLPIGDTIFATPTLRALRARYPAARITALVRAGVAPLLRCVPAVDDAVVLPVGADWKGPDALAGTLRRLRARRYDAAIDLTSPAYKWVSLACGIPLRTYMKFDPLWWILPGAHPRWQATHATRHYYDCARELDLPPWEEVDDRPSLRLPPEAREEARLFMEGGGIARGDGHGPLVGIHPGAAGLGGLKRWPPARFAALADRLHEEWGARILLLGGPDERGLAAQVAAGMRARPAIAAGATGLLASLALIEGCDLFVGNDSGPLHAAAALGTPYVGLFGPTCPANFAPVPQHAGQGIVVEPATPCRAPRHFVGGAPIWRRHDGCRCVCTALATLSVDGAFAAADAMPRQRGHAP